jgi:kumamolisin
MGPYTIDEVCEAYGFPDSQGEGECIGIVSLDGGYNQEEVDAFCGRRVDITEVPVNGAKNRPVWFETTQDIAIAASVAPKAKIAVYIATPSRWPEAFLETIQCAVRDSTNAPSVLCICYVYDEGIWRNPSGAALRKEVEREFESAKDKRITVCAATGDLAVGAMYPASSPWVLACGGTKLNLGAKGEVTNEPTWPDAGFGVSTLFKVPSWQSNIPGVDPAGRNVPDVSGYAWPGYMGKAGNHAFLFGTSAVAPLWAGLVARANSLYKTRVGFINERLYSGDAAPGSPTRSFDLHTGLGTQALLMLLTSRAANLGKSQ